MVFHFGFIWKQCESVETITKSTTRDNYPYVPLSTLMCILLNIYLMIKTWFYYQIRYYNVYSLLIAKYLIHMLLFLSLNDVLYFHCWTRIPSQKFESSKSDYLFIGLQEFSMIWSGAILSSAKIKFYIQLQYIALTYKTVFNPPRINLQRRQILLPSQSFSGALVSICCMYFMLYTQTSSSLYGTLTHHISIHTLHFFSFDR